MRRALTTAALAAAGTMLMPFAPASADDVTLPDGYVCSKDSVPSTVTGEGPAMKVDRNGNGYVCVYTNPHNGKWRFIDDTLVKSR